MKQKYASGFTLIELLVVIAVIGFIASLVMVFLNDARMKSRDAKRVSEVKQMMTALEQYYSECASYPAATSIVLGSATYTSLYSGGAACAGGGFGTAQTGTTYIKVITAAPTPNNNSNCT